MQEINRAVVTSNSLNASAAILSLGGQLHDFRTTGEDPLIRSVITENGRRRTVTIFQFLDKTTRGEPVDRLLKAYKALEASGGKCAELPANHQLFAFQAILQKRDEYHQLYNEAMRKQPVPRGPIPGVKTAYITCNTKEAALLDFLEGKRLGIEIYKERAHFMFELTDELQQYVDAWAAAWGKYLLDSDHILYHGRGVLENREFLIRESKNATVMVPVTHRGQRYDLPANASPEQLERIIKRLNGEKL